MNRYVLGIILAAALVLRLIIAFSQPTTIQYQAGGGDDGWYWLNGRALVSGVTTTEIDGVQIDVSNLAPPPLYLIFIGIPQQFLSQSSALIVVRVVQALMSTATCYFVYRMTIQLTRVLRRGDAVGRPFIDKSGLIAAAILAFSPAFILESTQITTETLFIFFLAAGLAAAAHYPLSVDGERGWGLLLLAAICFGLATLTRAVFLAFPVALVVYWVVIAPRKVARPAAFLLIYAAVVLTWTGYNLARWDRLVIAGEGFASFLYIGATGWDDPSSVDQRLADDIPDADLGAPTQAQITGAATNAITADTVGYLQRRVSELAGAFLQPHATTYFAGESLRDIGVTWLRDDRSFDGLIDLTRGAAFVPKLAIYLFHYGAIILGFIGIWRARRAWQLALPLVGYIGYTLAVHFFLLALPRYLFPTLLIWIVFAGLAFEHTTVSKILSAER